MRKVLKDLQRKVAITDTEYQLLMEYIEKLRSVSPESYELFYYRYASILLRDYNCYISRFAYGRDDFYDYLINHPAVLKKLKKGPVAVTEFPDYLREYLEDIYGQEVQTSSLLLLFKLICQEEEVENFKLPVPRQTRPVIKYEDANPYKEKGLKSHFERIARYSFVSRLQTYRHIYGRKAGHDKIEVLCGDCLGAIFSNKEKSIYYYIFLTENDIQKARNACQVLNLSLYKQNTGEI